MKNTTKYVLIGVGVLALVGIGLYVAAQRKKQAQAAPQEGGAVAVADKLISKIQNPEVAQQRLANRRVKQSTRQAKLLKKGKITVEDLRKLQTV
jgi:hypothetical protein